jgi:hypothetical protein
MSSSPGPLPFLKLERRSLRFSLRSLLLLTTVLCVWLGWQAHRAHEQQAALAFLRGVPVGSIKYDRRAEELSVPNWLRESIGDNFFRSVVEVHLTDSVTSENLPEIVSQLRRLPKLETVYLWHARVSDDDLRHLTPLTQISHLGLYFPWQPVTGTGVQHIAEMQNIRQLWLIGNSISNESLAFVPRFRRLETLNVGGSRISDDGICRLTACPRLKQLTLNSCDCTDEGLTAVASIGTLENVMFWNMDVEGPMEPGTSFRGRTWQLTPWGGMHTQNIMDGFENRKDRFDMLKSWLRRSGPNLEVNWMFHDA